jgi:hypothetical protein
MTLNVEAADRGPQNQHSDGKGSSVARMRMLWERRLRHRALNAAAQIDGELHLTRCDGSENPSCVMGHRTAKLHRFLLTADEAQGPAPAAAGQRPGQSIASLLLSFSSNSDRRAGGRANQARSLTRSVI